MYCLSSQEAVSKCFYSIPPPPPPSPQAQSQKLHEQLLHALNDQLQLNLMQQAQLMKEAPPPQSPPPTSTSSSTSANTSTPSFSSNGGNSSTTPSSTPSNAATSGSSGSGSTGGGGGRQRHQSANLQALLMEHQQIMHQIQLVQRQLAVASVLQQGPFSAAAAAMSHQGRGLVRPELGHLLL